MDSSKYLPMWNRVEPIMRSHLINVLAIMSTELNGKSLRDFTHSEITQGGDAEFRLDVGIHHKDVFVGELTFTLHDGAEQDGEGFGISLRWFGDESEVLAHAWAPGIYTDEVYTWDEDEIMRRLSEFDPAHTAKLAAADILELRLKKLCKQ